MDDGYKYQQKPISLDSKLEKPSYEQFLNWAKDADSKSLALDIWARGNYLRYIFSHRKNETPPVIVPFRFLDELRCYYRRLALMGLSAHFVYTGDLEPQRKCLTIHPADDYLIDAGAGWIAALGSKYRTRGRNWFPITGYSRRMPEVFAEWLISEAAEDFAQGSVFVSPAELIGIPKAYLDEGISMAAEVSESTSLTPQLAGAETIINLEIPYIDEMDQKTFSKILEDNDHRLARFRLAIKKLVKPKDGADFGDVIEELKDEVAQIRLSDSTLGMRQSIAKFGGVFTTFSVGLSAFGGAVGRSLSSLETIGPAVAGAATAGGVAAFIDIWKQSKERNFKRREGKYSILWDLGVKKPSDLKKSRSIVEIRALTKFEPALLTDSFDCHWLCEPAGMKFLAVRSISR